MAEPYIYQKLRALFRQHSADGTMPKKLIEANMAREFRLCREEVKKVLEEMHLENERLRRKRVKREEQVEYVQKTRDTYQNELRAFR